MPKQGHFAQSSRVRHLNGFRFHQRSSAATIDERKLTDYLLVRFSLTTKRRLPSERQESAQRFLIELLPLLSTDDGNLAHSLRQLLPTIVSRAPWQFFQQITTDWLALQHFLIRELPAVPLKHRLRITSSLSQSAFDDQVATILANQLATLMTLNLPANAQPAHAKLIGQFRSAILVGGKIDWSKVRALMKPYPFRFDADSVDGPTAKWLRQLANR